MSLRTLIQMTDFMTMRASKWNKVLLCRAKEIGRAALSPFVANMGI